MTAKWIIRGELLERKGGSAYGEDGSGKVEASAIASSPIKCPQY
jgi:hypothetical protein